MDVWADFEQTTVDEALDQCSGASDYRPMSGLKNRTLTHAMTWDAADCLKNRPLLLFPWKPQSGARPVPNL